VPSKHSGTTKYIGMEIYFHHSFQVYVAQLVDSTPKSAWFFIQFTVFIIFMIYIPCIEI